MRKNPTPRYIAIYTSLLLTLIVSVFSFIITKSWLQTLSIAAIIFIASYFLYLYTIEFFIYRKIKLIYKNIHTLKGKKAENALLNVLETADPINEVNKEVMRWAEDNGEEIAQLRKLEEFRKEFLGNVSHELKTPLFIIQGYINTLLDDDLDDKEMTLYFLRKAAKGVDRLAALVQDLEIITQLESGYITVEHETFDIYDLTRDVYDSLERRAADKNIELTYKAGKDTVLIVEADKDRIMQVLNNLVINAIKYSNENTKISIGLYDMEEYVLVEVTDEGLGISEEHLARLFERFYRVDKGRSRAEGGTGLGLSIVKHIIEAHGQTINVRSSIGVGSTFGFTLQKA